MSVTQKQIAAPPEAVWAVLADPDYYAGWVVGCRDIRDADAAWPAVGARFHHTLALGPIDLKDHSEVKESQAPHRLVLEVKARPFGRGYVELNLVAKDGGTHLEMREGPLSPGARLGHNPLADLLLHGRNVEALRRLAAFEPEPVEEGREPEPRTTHNSGPNAGGGERGPDMGAEG